VIAGNTGPQPPPGAPNRVGRQRTPPSLPGWWPTVSRQDRRLGPTSHVRRRPRRDRVAIHPAGLLRRAPSGVFGRTAVSSAGPARPTRPNGPIRRRPL